MNSIFATRLKMLMDECDLFNREEWSQFLNKDNLIIERWLTDKAFPEADILKMIVRVIFESDGTEPFRPHFVEMLSMPVGRVTPFAGQLEGLIGTCATLDEYLTAPLFQGFTRCLRTLPKNQMEEVIQQASEHARQLRKASRTS